MNKKRETVGVYGASPEQWRERLSRGLETKNLAELKTSLVQFGIEIREETQIISKIRRSPLIDRLIAQARRFLRSESSKQKRLGEELAEERALWAEYRRKYRETFVPPNLHPYLEDLAMFIAPSKRPPLYSGFDKYTGFDRGAGAEALTLFDPHEDAPSDLGFENVPNFFTGFYSRQRRFVIQRAYRGDLPRGAGEDCLFEHLTALSGDPSQLDRLTIENVQNNKTYDVFVSQQDGRNMVENPRVDDAPLVRLGRRLIERAGRSVGPIAVNLDSYGFLDLHMDTI